MPPEPNLHLVEDPQDSFELAKMVSGLANRAAGRAVCRPTPGPETSTELAADLLVALGKRFDALGFERVRHRAWQLVDLWMAAEQVAHLFVLRAHLLHPNRWRDLVALGRRRGIDVWLVGASLDAARRRSLEPTEPHRWSPDGFAEHWGPASTAQYRDSNHETPFPDVPAEDFPTFRAACRHLLDAGSFERVDSVYRQCMDDTDEWLRPWKPRGRRALPPSMELGDVAQHLQGLIVASSGSAEAVVRLRGAQAACFRAGWLIGFEPVVVASETGLVTLGPGLDAAVARRLRRLCTPRSVAAMALFLVADLRSEGLCRLDMADVDADGGAVAMRGGPRFAIPDYAASLLRAQLLDRRWAGAGDSEPLFVHPRTGGRYVGSALRNILRAAGAKTGIAVGMHDSIGWPHDAKSWLRRRGIALTQLNAVPAISG